MSHDSPVVPEPSSAQPGRSRPRWLLPAIAGGLFLFGGIFLAVGIVTWMSSNRLAKEGVTAPGEVIAMEARRSSSSGTNKSSSSSSTVYHPTYRFADAAGQVHEVTSSIGTSPPSYQVGDKVTVRYLTSAPQDAVIDSWTSLWLFPTIFIGVAFIPETAAIILLLVWARQRRSAAAATATAVAAGEGKRHSSLQERLERSRG